MKTEMPNQHESIQKAENLGLIACKMHDGMFHLAKGNMNDAMLQQKKEELESEGFSYTGEGNHPDGGGSLTFSYTNRDVDKDITDASATNE